MAGVKDVDKGWNRIQRQLKQLGGSYSKVGWPLGADPKKRPRSKRETISEVATVAAVHEFGAPKRNIPERSMIRATFDQEKQTVFKKKLKAFDDVLAGNVSPKEALGRIGEYMVNKVQKRMKEGISPALKPQTIKAKTTKGGKVGFVPLIDTAQMLQSLTHDEVMT